MIYRPTDECKSHWPDSKYVSWTLWRFMWVKKDRPEVIPHWGDNLNSTKHKPKQIWMWAYRYIPLCGRLYWQHEWMGTHSTLMPSGCVALISILSLCIAIGIAAGLLYRWEAGIIVGSGLMSAVIFFILYSFIRDLLEVLKR